MKQYWDDDGFFWEAEIRPQRTTSTRRAAKLRAQKDVCSLLNRPRKPSPGIAPKPLASANPKHTAIYSGGGGSSSKLSSVSRYAPGTLIDGQLTVATKPAVPSDRKG
jgi:hypothetical protein